MNRGSIARMSVSMSPAEAAALAQSLNDDISSSSTQSSNNNKNSDGAVRRRTSAGGGGVIGATAVSTLDIDANTDANVNANDTDLEAHGEDDTMDDNTLALRNESVRRQSDIRQSLKDTIPMFELSEGQTEEEIRENELILLADMELDEDFVARYKEAAEELREAEAEAVHSDG